MQKARKGRFFRRLLRVLCVLFVLVLILIFFYQRATRLALPPISDTTSLEWERKTISPNFYTVKNNFLRKNDNGFWEVYLEGAPFERGAAYGNLAQELLYSQEVAFVDQLKKMIPSESYIRFLKYGILWFNRHLDEHVPLEYQEEIYGESHFGPSEFAFIGKNYDRMLNYHAAHDIGHAIANANLAGCTSFALKKSATSDSSLLIARNLDFYMGDAFARDKMILFIRPNEGIPHAFVSWPGFLGVVSGMNLEGLTVTLNAAPSGIPSSAKTPISLLSRTILQYAKNIDEAIEIVKKHDVFVSELIMIGSANDGKAVILEKTPDTLMIFDNSSDRLTCSNHFQSLGIFAETENEKQFSKTSTEYRFQRINQLLNQFPTTSVSDAAHILRNRFGLDNQELGMGNENAINQLLAHHGIIFQPEKKRMWISANPYQLGAFVCYDLTRVFENVATIPHTKHPLHEESLTIPADSFLYTKTYQDYENFKIQTDSIHFFLQGKINLSWNEEKIKQYIALNPIYYLGYKMAGNYFLEKKDKAKAAYYYTLTLEKNIPLLVERNSIEKKLKKLRE